MHGSILEIVNCRVKGNITSLKDAAGGIFGSMFSQTIRINGCINYANVFGAHYGTGGISGGHWGGVVEIKNSSNFGIVTATGDSTHDGVGGMVGWNQTGLTIENCYNGGILKTVYRVGGSYRGAGGMLGNNNSGVVIIDNSVNYGSIDIKGTNQNIGGILGIANNQTTETVKLKQCYFNNEDVSKGIGKSAITEEIAIGKTIAEIQNQDFIKELNSNIEKGCPYQVENEDGTTETKTIDTVGWAKWVYNQNSYPTLDLTTTWNGTEWITEKDK